jgi:ABC-type Fe3+/spermidine/putrescine transport system ATPase subunit
MTRVRLDGMVKRYGSTTAVAGIDLDIAEGELLVLLGPSGCGKTTTLRCIAGLEDVSDGRILMGDAVVSSAGFSLPPERRGIGMVFQSYAVWPHMTVFENVAFGLKLDRSISRDRIETRVRTALDLVGLGALSQRGISQLSGGQQQRVALARAVVLEPKVLLFDEPLSNLDAKLREHMRFELRALQQRLGITSVYVTHDQQEAMVIADRIVLMQGGTIAQIGSPQELYSRPTSLFAAEFIGLTNAMRGEVVSPGRVRLVNGLMLESSDTAIAAGTAVDVMCRPEHVRIVPGIEGRENTFAAKIDEAVFLGNMSDIGIAIGDLHLRSQVSPAMSLPPASDIFVQLPREHVLLLRVAAEE